MRRASLLLDLRQKDRGVARWPGSFSGILQASFRQPASYRRRPPSAARTRTAASLTSGPRVIDGIDRLGSRARRPAPSPHRGPRQHYGSRKNANKVDYRVRLETDASEKDAQATPEKLHRQRAADSRGRLSPRADLRPPSPRALVGDASKSASRKITASSSPPAAATSKRKTSTARPPSLPPVEIFLPATSPALRIWKPMAATSP